MTRRRRLVLTACCLSVAGGGGGAAVGGLRTPATPRQGVNYAVTAHPIPLYVKILDFLHRDAHYRLLAREMTTDCRTDQARVLAVFDWTRRHIRPTPQDWPIMDDHILDIIIRGHGLSDQMADVFCTLATYAGVRAFWTLIRDVPESPGIVLSFANVNGRWRVFDVARGVVFIDPQGRLVAVETFLATPMLADVAHQVPVDISYTGYFERLQPLRVPKILRAEQQMPWPRLCVEMRRAFDALVSGAHPAAGRARRVSVN